MDILDILLDILLKPPQPFIGLFLWLTVLCQIDILAKFALWSSFQDKFERVVNELGGQKSSQGSI